jgi:hypothetical protein
MYDISYRSEQIINFGSSPKVGDVPGFKGPRVG